MLLCYMLLFYKHNHILACVPISSSYTFPKEYKK